MTFTMPDGMDVRPANSFEVAEFVRLWRRSLTRATERMVDFGRRNAGGRIHERYALGMFNHMVDQAFDEGAVVVVATLDDVSDVPLAYACITPEAEDSTDSTWLHFTYVVPSARRRGLGTALIASIASEASRGVKPTYVNAAGRRLLDRVRAIVRAGEAYA